MQLHSYLLAITTTLLLLSPINAYGTSNSVSNTNSFEKASTLIAIGSNKNKNEDIILIEPKLYQQNDHNHLFFFSSYYIQKKDQSTFKYPNVIKHVKFDEEVLVFDDSAKLPNIESWSLFSVYTSKDYRPLLIRIHISDGYFFYSPDPNTLKWTNYTIDSLKYFENKDENDVTYYKLDKRDDINNFYNNIWKETHVIYERLYNNSEIRKEDAQKPSMTRIEPATSSTGKPLSTFKSLRTSLLGQYDSLVNRLHISQPGLNEDLVYYSQRELDVTLHTLDSLISRLDSSPDDWLSIAADLLDSINRLTRLVDSTYIKVMDTLKTDKARSTLAQDYMTYKSENLSYMLDSLSLLISDIPNADPKSVEEFESIRHASKTSPRNHLAANRPDLQICFDELSAQTMNATKSFKRVIESAQDDQDPEDNQPYTPDQPSDPKANDEDTDKDKDPSACILPRMLALMIPAFILILI